MLQPFAQSGWLLTEVILTAPLLQPVSVHLLNHLNLSKMQRCRKSSLKLMQQFLIHLSQKALVGKNPIFQFKSFKVKLPLLNHQPYSETEDCSRRYMRKISMCVDKVKPNNKEIL